MKMELKLENKMEHEDKKYELFSIGSYEVEVTTYNCGVQFFYTRVKRGYYTPEICSRENIQGTLLGFEIQTTAYGTLTAEEIKKVIAGYNEALEVVAILTAEFVSK